MKDYQLINNRRIGLGEISKGSHIINKRGAKKPDNLYFFSVAKSKCPANATRKTGCDQKSKAGRVSEVSPAVLNKFKDVFFAAPAIRSSR